MGIKFRKIKIGIANLSFYIVAGQKKASEHLDNIKRYLVEEFNVELVDLKEPIPDRAMGIKAWKKFKAEDVDAVILFNGTFSTGDVTVEIASNLKIPYAMWGFQELDIENRNQTGSMVGLLANAAVLRKMGTRFSFIYGPIEQDSAQKELHNFISAVRAIAYLREAKVALLGTRPDGFEICDFDEVAIKEQFGTELSRSSLFAFTRIMDGIEEDEIEKDLIEQQRLFNIPKEDLEEAKGLSRTYLAVKQVVEKQNIQAYAPECWPDIRDNLKCPICPTNGRMNVEGVMASCECDVDGSLSMMLQYAIAQTTPWLADYVNMIEDKDAVLWWHCGNAPYNLSLQKPLIERVFGGLAQTAALRRGEVTICRLNSTHGKYTLFVGIGEALDTTPYLKGSNMLVRMKGGNREFTEAMLEYGIPHHNSVIYGNIVDELKEFANLMNIPIVIQS